MILELLSSAMNAKEIID
ncbi:MULTISPECIES: hypothetical protein [unclassified Microcoleus]|nr:MULTISPECIES: hypothetical protein [unclassified Microcoleus]